MAGTSLEPHSAASAAGDGHGAVEQVSHLPALSYNPDAPSEAWGWHGEWRLFASRGSRLLLGVFTAMIFLMIFGNQVSHVEDWWLAGIGILMVIWLVSREAAARRERNHRP
ncbi:MAG: DUF2631 domain-containing protein [Nakamurella sp.]